MKEESKPRIFLDIDQTLISAEACDEYNFKSNKEKASKFKYHDMDGYYIVFERPGLQEFLDFLFKNFIVSIWTAASKDYALFVIEKVILQGKPDRKLEYVFFSYHCDISKKFRKGSKDLTTLWEIYKFPDFNENNTMILDDYDEVYKTQPRNCVMAIPFEFSKRNSYEDNFLIELIPLLTNLKNSVQKGETISKTLPTINEKFGETSKVKQK